MKKFTKYILCLVLCCLMLPVQALAKELIPVGQVVGLELQEGKVTVAAFEDTPENPSRAAGIQIGDHILRINGSAIHAAEDIRNALNQSKGRVRLDISRDGKELTLHVSPTITAGGPKLGLYLRQGISGIGTVTWYDPEQGTFGTLGHGVNNADGNLLSFFNGNAYAARVVSVRKGKSGEPGQLMGAIESRTPIGELTANTPQGVFGTTQTGWQGAAMEVANPEEVQPGPAVIRSTVSGKNVQEYSVEILKIYPAARQNGRNLLLKVTDPDLLAATGGIVQGMSGSPIIQNGKLIGAVTHVLVNDPQTGYGIFIENMLEAAS